MVCPGVCTGTGAPGRSRATGAGNACGSQTGTWVVPPTRRACTAPREHTGPPCLREHLSDRHLVEEVAAGVRHLVLVHEDRHVVRGAQVHGRADVVVVRVGDQDGGHGACVQPDLLQRGEHDVAVAGVAGVDEGAAVPVLDDPPVGVAPGHRIDVALDADDVVLTQKLRHGRSDPLVVPKPT
ncbi:hypothetical protein SSPO_097170 [Streptomyces antimycoticus]|uniref:Uncharacterized protein n=1 Tax=Streptomyces antimycoticus TaxID=68175 RepID=A0A499VDG6_9ACTN|nr:hypothetical protein SSPO_097170 [Streptomyces antimycoticus]